MRILIALVAVACFNVSALAQQPTQPPKPDPELKKLAVYVGQWRYEGESKAGPLGPAARVTGDASGEMFLRGFFLQWRWEEQTPAGVTRGIEILGYNRAKNTYPSNSYSDDGTSSSGEYTLSENTSTFVGMALIGGKQYGVRATEVFAPDLMSFTRKEAISVDGTTWVPSYEVAFSKVKPPTKK